MMSADVMTQGRRPGSRRRPVVTAAFLASALALSSPVKVAPAHEPLARVPIADEDGYDLWLRYRRLPPGPRAQENRGVLARIVVESSSPTLDAARDELVRGLTGLLGAARWIERSRRRVRSCSERRRRR